VCSFLLKSLFKLGCERQNGKYRLLKKLAISPLLDKAFTEKL